MMKTTLATVVSKLQDPVFADTEQRPSIPLLLQKTTLPPPAETKNLSALDRVNVRRLLNYIERVIAEATTFELFEFNDALSRAMFRDLLNPILTDLERRGTITDFTVVCNETNNHPNATNEFVADIYLKPTPSINYITLNFTATRTAVNFEEIAGS